MYKEPTTTQATGMIIAVIGLLINNGFFIYIIFKIKQAFKENQVKEKYFPPLAIYFQFRELISTTYNLEKKKSYQRILKLLHWSFLISIAIMFLGGLIATV